MLPRASRRPATAPARPLRPRRPYSLPQPPRREPPIAAREPPPPSSTPKATSSSTPPSTSTTSSAPAGAGEQSANARIARLHSRLPRFLQRYVSRLRDAPVSHVTSFLLLHEITAAAPLLGLAAYFYHAERLPWFAEGKLFNEGVRRFGDYFRRKGWLGDGGDGGGGEMGPDGKKMQASRRWRWWGRGENGVKLVTSFAAAYAITKVLLPLRLAMSLWLTPAFARTTVIPITRWCRGIFKGREKA